MSRRRRLNKTEFYSEHHLTPKNPLGRKGRDKKRVPHNKHVAWHTLVKNALPDKAAEILSEWIRRNSRFFAITKGESIYKTVQEINRFLEDDDFKIKVVYKQSKVMQFPPKQNYRLLFPKIVS